MADVQRNSGSVDWAKSFFHHRDLIIAGIKERNCVVTLVVRGSLSLHAGIGADNSQSSADNNCTSLVCDSSGNLSRRSLSDRNTPQSR